MEIVVIKGYYAAVPKRKKRTVKKAKPQVKRTPNVLAKPRLWKEAKVTAFGNYLLNKYSDLGHEVTHADVENFLYRYSKK